VTAIYMAAEKASAAILADAERTAPGAPGVPAAAQAAVRVAATARSDLRRVLAHLPRPRSPHRNDPAVQEIR
jgi:hypothetical protein